MSPGSNLDAPSAVDHQQVADPGLSPKELADLEEYRPSPETIKAYWDAREKAGVKRPAGA